MIKFFRSIRKKLLSENKFSKYLLYALGEIVLVVIGILIALQINNWNETQKEVKEEKAILQNLHEEFTVNKKMYEFNSSRNENAKRVGYRLMSLIGKSQKELAQQNIDSLLYNLLEAGQYRPSENTINDLIQSGRLKLLKNKKLKTLLYNWKSELKELDVAFERLELKIDNELIPYLSKHYPLKDIDKYGALQWKENSRLKVDKFAIFNDIEFENITDDYIYRIIIADNSLMRIGKTLNAILEETHD